jgi:hydroxyacylglutathione hydrolase
MTTAYAEAGPGSMQLALALQGGKECTMAKIEIISCLKDNYAYLVLGDGFAAVVDPSEAAPVAAVLEGRGLRLSHILNTHHHWDHSGGNAALKARYGAQVVGPEKDRARIPGIDIGVDEAGFQLGGTAVQVLEVPAHTSGAIAFVIGQAVFTGDTLFAMGCGRLFEGTAAMMAASLAKLAALPDGTEVYCGHEYTLGNGRFALTLEPGNQTLVERVKAVEALRAAGKPTVPSSIGLEKATNPFLRTGSKEIRATLKMERAEAVAVFAEIRKRKDSF